VGENKQCDKNGASVLKMEEKLLVVVVRSREKRSNYTLPKMGRVGETDDTPYLKWGE
jgi:hypothetical protein